MHNGRMVMTTLTSRLTQAAEEIKLAPAELWPFVEAFLHYRFLRTLTRGHTRYAALTVPEPWAATPLADGFQEHERTAFVHQGLKIPWMSLFRIETYRSGYDFNNAVNIDKHGDGKSFFDLHQCREVSIDYTSGAHGCVGVALTHDDEYVFHITLVTRETADRIRTRVTVLQRWLRRRASVLG